MSSTSIYVWGPYCYDDNHMLRCNLEKQYSMIVMMVMMVNDGSLGCAIDARQKIERAEMVCCLLRRKHRSNSG